MRSSVPGSTSLHIRIKPCLKIQFGCWSPLGSLMAIAMKRSLWVPFAVSIRPSTAPCTWCFMCVVRLKDHVWDAVPVSSMSMSSSSVRITPNMGIMVPDRPLLLANSPWPLLGEGPMYTSFHSCLPPLVGEGLMYLVLRGMLISVPSPWR